MSIVGTTRMSSKGQVVIPEEVRERLGWAAGTQFVVLAENDVVILRPIAPPRMAEFDRQIAAARRAARRAGMTKADVKAAVVAVRRRGKTRIGS